MFENTSPHPRLPSRNSDTATPLLYLLQLPQSHQGTDGSFRVNLLTYFTAKNLDVRLTLN